MGFEALEQVEKRCCGWTIPEGVQGWVGWDPEQPDVVGGIPACDRGVASELYLWFFPTETILWFYDP